MRVRTDKVKDEIARQASGLTGNDYAEFLLAVAREVNIMASYASGNEGRPHLSVVQP